MLRTTVGQLLVNEILPPDLRDYHMRLDKKSIKALLRRVADSYPEKYNEIASALMKLGAEISTTHGAEASLSLNDLQIGDEARKLRNSLRRGINKILTGPGTNEEKNKAITLLVGRHAEKLRQVNFKEQLAKRNGMAMQVASGARGNPVQFSAINVGDLLVQDHRDRLVPVPILNSYAEGLDPVEYWAGSYGARKGSVDAKFCLYSMTLVRMADGSVKPIKDIVPGDMVLGVDYTGRCRPVKVLSVFNNGERECYRYKFRKNATRQFVELVATENHEVLSEWRSARAHDYKPKLRQLGVAKFYARTSENQFVAVPARGFTVTSGIHEHRAWIVGLLISRGCLAPSVHGVRLACADPQLLVDIKQPLAELGFKTVLLNKSQHNYHLTEIEDRPNKQQMHPFRKWLGEIGLWGKLAHEKTLPQDVWQWDDESLAALIGGIYSTSGCIHVRKNGRIEIGLYMAAEQVIRQLHELLEVRFGIYATAICERAITGIMKHVQYGFTINYNECVRTFAERIPLLGSKRRTLAAAIKTLTESSSRLGYKIYSREPAGKLPTYDLEVDHPDHMFVLANGLIVANSTPKGGFLAKQLMLAAHRLVVTEDDCGTANGIPAAGNDPDNEGAVLARPAGGYPAGTVIDTKVMKKLRGLKQIYVRSPITCQAKGGICAKCAGIREKGKFPEIGDNIGIAAAQAIAEPVSQSALSSKHSGGIAGAGPTAAGFDAINQLVQVPKTYTGGAVISTLDGIVEAIEPAPQGGQYVTVNGVKHHVATGFKLKVKKGDKVEAGDVLSEGLPNPAEFVRYKGIGAGRWQFVNVMRDTLKNSKISANRRNIELLARGLINHARITSQNGPQYTLPNDIVEYDTLVRGYEPRPGTKNLAPKRAVGKYLEEPILQYSIGTRITPRIADALTKHGYKTVKAHTDEPPFVPEMVRAMETLGYSGDWMVRLGGFHLKKNLLESVHRGRGSTERGLSYIPALAKGVGFGTASLNKPER